MALPVNAIMKVTRNCNLGCAYCHDRLLDGDNMPFEKMALAIERILSINTTQSFRFIWHGGEPLLVGLDFFRKAVAVQEYLKYPGQEIKNFLQTNGTMLTSKVLGFLKEFDFTVGVSLDGPELIHDAQRPFRRGRPSFSRIMKGIEELQRREISSGVISVLTEKSLTMNPRKFLEFYRDNGIFDICFLPMRADSSLDGDTLEGERYYGFMKELFDEWLLMNDPRMRIREFGDMLLLSMGYPGSMCSSSGSCVGGTYSIEPDGSVFHCDKFSRDSTYCFGDLSGLDFNQLLDSPKGVALKQLDLGLPEVCKTCEWRQHCAGGCSHDRLVEKRLARQDGVCHMRSMLYHVRERTRDHPKIQEYVQKARESRLH
jgi:uncharacterized protein